MVGLVGPRSRRRYPELRYPRATLHSRYEPDDRSNIQLQNQCPLGQVTGWFLTSNGSSATLTGSYSLLPVYSTHTRPPRETSHLSSHSLLQSRPPGRSCWPDWQVLLG